MKKVKENNRTLSKQITKFIFFVTLCALQMPIFAEGTKELSPNNNDKTALLINDPDNFSFAKYNSDPNYALNFYINDPSTEIVYFGFGTFYSNTDASEDYAEYRIKDEDGNIVWDFNKAGINTKAADGKKIKEPKEKGRNIANKTEAINGPNQAKDVTNGYDAFSFVPTKKGIYSIEIKRWGEEDNNTIKLFCNNWDITVCKNNSAKEKISGRVFSYCWALNTPNKTSTNDYSGEFNGTIYGYCEEDGFKGGYVNKIDFNGSGFRGKKFCLALNSSGTQNTESFEINRKSTVGKDNKSLAPEYKVFLNDPDQTAFPSASDFGEMLIDKDKGYPKFFGCEDNKEYFFRVAVTKKGRIEILIDFDGDNMEYDAGTRDVILYERIIPYPGEMPPYIRDIEWNGHDGKNNPVYDPSNPKKIHSEIKYCQGTFHFPVYDVEFMEKGFTPESKRPKRADFKTQLYWDDTEIEKTSASPPTSGIPGQNYLNITGVDSPAQNHRWINQSYGEEKTINTYWNSYAKRYDDPFDFAPPPGGCDYYEKGTISGFTFFDFNENGIKDPSEIPSKGKKLIFYEDVNNNKTLDASDKKLEEALSNDDGRYSFKMVFGKAYLIKLEKPDLINCTLSNPIQSFSYFSKGAGNGNANFGFNYTPSLHLELSKNPINENDKTPTKLKLVIDEPYPLEITANLIRSGSAVIDEDYTLPDSFKNNNIISIPPYQKEASIPISMVDDIFKEKDETLKLEIESIPSTALIGTPKSVELTIEDDDPARFILSKPTLRTSEDGIEDNVFVSLNGEPSKPVEVTLSVTESDEGKVIIPTNKLIINDKNWNTDNEIRIKGIDDNLIDGPIIYKLRLNANSIDTDFKINTEIDVTNDDNDIAELVFDNISNLKTKEEGETLASFNIHLSAKPKGDVVVQYESSNPEEGLTIGNMITFTPSTWNIDQLITVQGKDDLYADGDQPYKINFTINSASDTDFDKLTTFVDITNIDNDKAKVIFSDTDDLTTDENGKKCNFYVVLGAKPISTFDVIVTIKSLNTTEGIVNPTTLTFNKDNWNTKKQIEVTGINDDLIDGDQDYEIEFSYSSGDPAFDKMTPTKITVNNIDNDIPGIIFENNDIQITSEDQTTQKFKFKLQAKPKKPVTVLLKSSDDTEGIPTTTSFTFDSTTWDIFQEAEVKGVDDFIIDKTQEYTIRFSTKSDETAYEIENLANRKFNNEDNDKAGILVNLGDGITVKEEGETTDQFTFCLTACPKGEVTIPVAIKWDDKDEALVDGQSDFSFDSSNWNIPQTVTIKAKDDDLVDGDKKFIIYFPVVPTFDIDFNNCTRPEIEGINIDNDKAGLEFALHTNLKTSEDKGNANFKIKLSAKPTKNVIVTIASTDETEGIIEGSKTLTFTPYSWKNYKPILLKGVDDALVDGNQNYQITFKVKSDSDIFDDIAVTPIDVINLDDDNAELKFTNHSNLETSEEGPGSDSFDICLTAKPTADVNIQINHSDPTEGTLDKTSIDFTTENWNNPQTITITGVDDFDVDGKKISTINFTSSSTQAEFDKITIPSISVANKDNDFAGINVLATKPYKLTTSEEGTSDELQLQLGSKPSQTVTINVSSPLAGEGSINKNTFIFDPSNWNITQTLIVTGLNDDFIDYDKNYDLTLSCSSTDLDYNKADNVIIKVTNEDNNFAGVKFTTPTSLETKEEGETIATLGIALGAQPAKKVMIVVANVIPAEEGQILTPSITIEPSDWNVPHIFQVKGVDDDLVDGDQTYKIRFITDSKDGAYSGLMWPQIDEITVKNIDNNHAGLNFFDDKNLRTKEEGETTTNYYLNLGSKPTNNVNIQLSSSNTSEGDITPKSVIIIPENWKKKFKITAKGKDDPYIDKDQSYQINYTTTSADKAFDKISPITPTTVTNEDNDFAGLIFNKISNIETLEEGETSYTFSFQLGAKPQKTVTINLNHPDPSEGYLSKVKYIINPEDWNKTQSVTVNGVNDNLVDGDITYNISLTSKSTDPVFDKLSIPNIPVTNKDNNHAGVRLVNAKDIITTEGDDTPHTVGITLGAQPEKGNDVTITLSNPLNTDGTPSDEGTISKKTFTFTYDNWNNIQNIGIQSVNDDFVDGDQDYVIKVSSSSIDPTFTGITIPDIPVTNKDNNTATITFDKISKLETKEEGETTDEFTFTFGGRPLQEVEVSFVVNDKTEGKIVPAEKIIVKPENWNIPQIVIIKGLDDVIIDGDIKYQIDVTTKSKDVLFTNLATPKIEVTNIDNNFPGINFSDLTNLETSEDGSKNETIELSLGAKPLKDVKIIASITDLSEGNINKTQFTFTPDTWNIPQNLIVNGEDDNIIDGNIKHEITITTQSLQAAFNNLTVTPIQITNIDDDKAELIFSNHQNLKTSEDGTSQTFKIALAAMPKDEVTVNLAVSNTLEGTLDANTIKFSRTDWNTKKTINITGIDDDIIDGNITHQIMFTTISSDSDFNNLKTPDLDIINEDNDIAELKISFTEALTTTESNTEKKEFEIQLSAKPKTNVDVSFQNIDATEHSLDKNKITFTTSNWNIPQKIAISSVDDYLVDGEISYAIKLICNSSDSDFNNLSKNLSISNKDNDRAGVNTLVASKLITKEEGETKTSFNISLTAEPTEKVKINISVDDESEINVISKVIEFLPSEWNTLKTVEIKAADDFIIDGVITSNIQFNTESSDINFNELSITTVPVKTLDNDYADVMIDKTTIITSEDETTDYFNLKLTAEPFKPVSIKVEITNPKEGTTTDDIITFTSKNWNTEQAVVIKGVDDNYIDGNISYPIHLKMDTEDINFKTLSLPDIQATNEDNDEGGFVIDKRTLTTSEDGTTDNFIIRLKAIPSTDVQLEIKVTENTEGKLSTNLLTIKPEQWNAENTVTLTGLDDFIIDGDISYQITLASTSADINFDKASLEPIVATNLDNDVAGISLNKGENIITKEDGSSHTFGVKLKAKPKEAVDITLKVEDDTEGTLDKLKLHFLPENWNTLQKVTVSGVDDKLVDRDQVYNISIGCISKDKDFDKIKITPIEVLNKDDEKPSVIKEDKILIISEDGDIAKFNLCLDTKPINEVKVILKVDDETEASLSTSEIIFTPDDFKNKKLVEVIPEDDFIIDGDVECKILFEVKSLDPIYNKLEVSSINVKNKDNDFAEFKISKNKLETDENGKVDQFNISLSCQPKEPITIALHNTDPTEGSLNKIIVVFNEDNWDTSSSFIVTGLDDNIPDKDITYPIEFKISTEDPDFKTLSIDNVIVINRDNEVANLVCNKKELKTHELGAQDVVNFKLNAKPSSEVNIKVVGLDKTEGKLNKDEFNFSPDNWNKEQSLIVTGVDDTDYDGDIKYVLNFEASSDDKYFDKAKIQPINIINKDSEKPAIFVSDISNNTNEDGTSAYFTISLNTNPYQSVKIGLESTNTKEGKLLQDFVIIDDSNWESGVDIMVIGVNDNYWDDDKEFYIITDIAQSLDSRFHKINPKDVFVINENNKSVNDSDEDTISDEIETDDDTDGDGIPNYLDLDSDNDGISDKDELPGDCDEDGIVNRLDPDQCGVLNIPEGFSPNQDGYNDTFHIVGTSFYSQIKLVIINGWGDKVYESDDYKNDWNGTYNVGSYKGENLLNGTYIYLIEIVDTGKIIKGCTYINR
ncbi:MAG: gliding motility-associated C-terminal domain-containing protein [Bacteroidales bacterium]